MCWNTCVHANLNARVEYILTKYTCVHFVQTMIHIAPKWHLLCAHMLTSSILHAHTDNVVCVFRNMLSDSSHVVAICMCSQDTIELYCIYACNHTAIKKHGQLLKLLFIVIFNSFTFCYLTHKITGNKLKL